MWAHCNTTPPKPAPPLFSSLSLFSRVAVELPYPKNVQFYLRPDPNNSLSGSEYHRGPSGSASEPFPGSEQNGFSTTLPISIHQYQHSPHRRSNRHGLQPDPLLHPPSHRQRRRPRLLLSEFHRRRSTGSTAVSEEAEAGTFSCR